MEASPAINYIAYYTHTVSVDTEYTQITPQVERKNIYIVMLRKATKVCVYFQCFSLSFSKPERIS